MGKKKPSEIGHDKKLVILDYHYSGVPIEEIVKRLYVSDTTIRHVINDMEVTESKERSQLRLPI